MSRTANPRATLAAVAERAGVSKATASKVLNGRPGVSDETRRLVRKAIEELGYMPSTGPREPQGKGSINVVFDHILDMYSLYVLDGVIEGAAAFDVDVVTGVVATEETPNARSMGEARIRDIAARGHVGLIVVTSELTGAEIETCESLGLPLVVIDPVNPLDDRVTSVGATNWAGGVQATRHLIDLGHRRIGYIGGPNGSVFGRERLHGYREALEAAGIHADSALTATGHYDAASGGEAARALLSLDEPPTAIFAANDTMALGVLREARSRGLRVPEDLSLVGFDDTYSAAWTDPPLTTVRQPLRQMGRVAARTALELAEGRVPDSHHVQLATSLVIRESTAPPR
ncbi:LacI family DNA-binding transcriptional regulator [Glycomyces sp. NPDC046736]|uniref:LacI family DNA-binding transcriptional regulator n=1 Tax=Glycomyces sp. NPDC046736 TaxID=3155615 RepID=UPI0033ED02FF